MITSSLEVISWEWGVVAVVAALALGFGLAVRLRRGERQFPPNRLWKALGRPVPTMESPDQAWAAVDSQVAKVRDASRRAQRLQLRTTAIEHEFGLISHVLRTMPDGIVVLDRSERILYSNRTAQRILGLESQDVQGLEQASASLEILDGIRSVVSADLARHVMRRKIEWSEDDQIRTFVIRCLVPDDENQSMSLDSFIVVLEDHTAEEKASRAKTDFVYGISHELKTPLTSIQASLEMLADEPDLPLEERSKLVELSLGESERLGRMVRELLDLARVEAGITEFKKDKVGVGELLNGLYDLHLSLAGRNAIDLTWEVSEYLPSLLGDAALLRQALINLIGNAIKYTKTGGSVVVGASIEGEELLISIRDSGIGIASEDLPRVFDKFFRAGSAEQSKVQGTGLGLPMARYIVERHRGRVEVSSELGVGTEFKVYLPAGRTESSEEDASTFAAMDGAR